MTTEAKLKRFRDTQQQVEAEIGKTTVGDIA